MESEAGQGVYERAELYDIAFDFRDVSAETDFLLEQMSRHGCGQRSFLELACGPGQHVVEMGRRGLRSRGLDLCPQMIRFLEFKGHQAHSSVRGMIADMRCFEAPDRFDGAALLMDSITHLLTNQDLLDHLSAVADHLEDGGIYVLEMAHPSNHFGAATARTEWKMERDGIAVHTAWGQPEDAFDSLTQIDDVTVVMDVTRVDGSSDRYVDHLQVRRWTKPHFEAVVGLSGRFEIMEWYGSLDASVPLDHQKASWRMVPVLRKIVL